MKKLSRLDRLALLFCGIVVLFVAAIPVQNVLTFMKLAKSARAQSEIAGADQAIKALLADARVDQLHELFAEFPGLELHGGEDCEREYGERCTEIVYALLTKGRHAAAIDLKPEYRQKLGTSYQNLGDDPWGRPYRFWIPAPTPEPVCGVVPETAFVSYQYDRGWDITSHTFADPGLQLYIYSLGANGRSDQPLHHNGELQPKGDDIGAW